MTYSDNDSWEKFEDDDDPYSPPSSPPPPHIILYPENYHAGSGKSWQHDYASQIPRYSGNQTTSHSYQSPSTYSASSEPDEKRNNNNNKKVTTTVRKHTLKIFKMLLRMIFSNNNLLLAVTLTNRLWRSRESIFIKPYHSMVRQVRLYLPSDYKEALMLVKMMRSVALHYYFKIMSHTRKIQSGGGGINNVKGNKHAILFMLSNLQQVYRISLKYTNRWIAQAIRGIGGLDAFILAIGTVTFTKYIQRSNRIF